MYDNNMRPRIVVALCRWPQAPASNTETVDLTEKLLGPPSSFSTLITHICPACATGVFSISDMCDDCCVLG